MLDLTGLPKISGPHAKLHNLLLQLPDVMIVELPSLSLALSLAHQQPLSDRLLCFDLQTDIGVLEVTIDQALIDLLSDHALPGWQQEDPEALPLDWRVTCCLTQFLQATPLADLRPEISNIRSQAAQRDRADLCLTGQVSTMDQRFGLQIRVKSGDPARLQALMSQLGISRAPEPGLRVPAIVTLPGYASDLGRVRRYQPGDLLLFAFEGTQPLPCSLRLPGGRLCHGSLSEDGQFTSLQDMERRFDMDGVYPDDPQQDDALQETPVNNGAAAPDLGALADVPVRLEFQFHATDLSLAEFSSLTAGSLLDLGIDFEKPLQIKANNQVVGSGVLVQIGNRIGLQIERWYAAPGSK